MSDELAQLRAKADEAKATYERFRHIVGGRRFEMSHFEAEERFRALHLPLCDEVDPRLLTKYGDEFDTIVYRLRRQLGRWPSVASVLGLFGLEHRYTVKASGQLFAAELERDGTCLFLYLCDDFGNDDWCVMIDGDRMALVHDSYLAWEQIEEQLIAGIRRVNQGDPDPFGVQDARR